MWPYVSTLTVCSAFFFFHSPLLFFLWSGRQTPGSAGGLFFLSCGVCGKRGTGLEGEGERFAGCAEVEQGVWWWCSATSTPGPERGGGPWGLNGWRSSRRACCAVGRRETTHYETVHSKQLKQLINQLIWTENIINLPFITEKGRTLGVQLHTSVLNSLSYDNDVTYGNCIV